jgi:hypothetical protein
MYDYKVIDHYFDDELGKVLVCVWVNITYSYIQEDMFQYSFSEGIT